MIARIDRLWSRTTAVNIIWDRKRFAFNIYIITITKNHNHYRLFSRNVNLLTTFSVCCV